MHLQCDIHDGQRGRKLSWQCSSPRLNLRATSCREAPQTITTELLDEANCSSQASAWTDNVRRVVQDVALQGENSMLWRESAACTMHQWQTI